MQRHQGMDVFLLIRKLKENVIVKWQQQGWSGTCQRKAEDQCRRKYIAIANRCILVTDEYRKYCYRVQLSFCSLWKGNPWKC